MWILVHRPGTEPISPAPQGRFLTTGPPGKSPKYITTSRALSHLISLTHLWDKHIYSKITADGDCSHEIKRCLLLGREVMTNLDSILNSRDITLLTKVRLLKAMVSPVVMYALESWTIKKAEHWRIHAFELYWRRFLRVSWTARRSNQFILNEINFEYSLQGLMLKLTLQYFGHLIWWTDSFEKTLMLGKIEGGRRRGQLRMRW